MKTITKSILLTMALIIPTLSIVSLEYLSYNMDDDNNGPWVTFFKEKACVSWELETEHTGFVKYGKDPTSLSYEKPTIKSSKIQHVLLEGLDPKTKYFYEVYADSKKIGNGSFITSSNEREDFSFAVIADVQQPKIAVGGFPKIAQRISEGDYRFLAIVGDFVDDGTSKANFNNFFHNARRFSDRVPIIPVMGNHDNHRNGIWFKQYFINNESNDLFYYSFNYSSIHFLVLQFTFAREYEFIDQQMEFVKQDLENAKDASYRIVMFHCPPAGAGFFNYNQLLIERLVPILEEKNVTVVFSGHEHHYERAVRNNITYFVVGIGGGIQDPGLTPVEGTQIMTALPCYTVVSLNSTGLYAKTLTTYNAVIDEVKLG